ncbi:type II toxin-antitoxin system HipA family toxin [Ramlibacter albus]|uniref:Type II toxin-antitoxin system HipA family toxin n=1 Tax=Ramlibacter albus TaxID=2079448 RepID=A0A923M4Z0_9BURK|nr:type II toxin-antitoxin system HipA family toxin [Ramlibacter albus]MBC5763998.1 type II toxin-antitoxin system HipA family toxin [Ramlibacter albus]
MGRKSRTRALSIWANGVRVGTWRILPRGEMELQYDEAWRASEGGRPLSLSLPFGADNSPLRGAAVENYFDNLLPDSDGIRRRIAERFKTQSLSAFDLLTAVGRDCVGAVQLLPDHDKPEAVEKIEGTLLSEEEVAAHLRGIVSPRFPGYDDGEGFRISLAGMQEKTALLWHGGRWLLPHGATPTTHILKLPLGRVGNMRADFSTSVENEWLCMQLMEAFGLQVPRTAVLSFDGQKVLGVERFDRLLDLSGRWIARLPQEDFCQVYGLPHTRKYEADGGPGLQQIAGKLLNSERREEDIATLMKAQVLFWMLAATDGHAKNFSIRLLPQGRYRLTPIYDVMSILPAMGDAPSQLRWHKAKLAMAVSGKNRHYLLKDIQRRHFNATARKAGYGPTAEPLIEDILSRLPGAIAAVASRLPAGFPQRVADTILNGLRASAERLAGMPPT